jgi:hypothetical protein
VNDDRIERARLLWERAVFGGDGSLLATPQRELDVFEADLALARGRLAHAPFFENHNEDPHELALFERAAELYRTLGDVRREAEALLWVGAFHQVVRKDNAAAMPVFERARKLAVEVEDKLTLSYALRHRGIAEHSAGRLDAARERLEESRLRREIEFLLGVAAHLVGLAISRPRRANRDNALALLEEGAIEETSGSEGIMRQVAEARAQL